MGTKNNPGKYDCYDKAEPDEPIFVLLGRDWKAAIAIAVWADLAAKEGETPEKVVEAEECVKECLNWAFLRAGANPPPTKDIVATLTEALSQHHPRREATVAKIIGIPRRVGRAAVRDAFVEIRRLIERLAHPLRTVRAEPPDCNESDSNPRQ